jgi:RNA polymerase sigma factor (TIGR02999 family)
MTDVTRILSDIDQGDPHAAAQLLPLVYEELRKLAAHRLAREKPGQTLQPTALVHEAYLRLVDTDRQQHWNSRNHFLAAAAEAMRRILVESARRKRSLKQGGQLRRRDADLEQIITQVGSHDDVLAIDDALAKLARENGPVARVVELRYFAGLSMEECAAVLEVTVRTAQRYWAYARAWLHHEIGSADEAPSGGSPDHNS